MLQVMEKVFEIIVYKWISFLNGALDKYDKWNCGYILNIRTADNMFIVNGEIIIAYVKIQNKQDILSIMSIIQPNCRLKIDF